MNRSTFYAHYDHVQELMEEIELGIGKRFFETIPQAQPDKSHFMSRRHLVIVLERVQENQTFYRAYLHTSYGTQRIEWGFNQLLEGIARPYMHQLGLVNDEEIQYYFEFVMSGLLAMIRRWVNRGCPEPPEELARIAGNVLQHPEFQW